MTKEVWKIVDGEPVLTKVQDFTVKMGDEGKLDPELITDEMVGGVDEYGREILDPTPLYVQLGIEPDLDIIERTKMMTQTGVFGQIAEARGFESYEDANDFGEDEGDDPLTGYEAVVMAEDYIGDETASSTPEDTFEGQPTSSPQTNTEPVEGEEGQSQQSSVAAA